MGSGHAKQHSLSVQIAHVLIAGCQFQRVKQTVTIVPMKVRLGRRAVGRHCWRELPLWVVEGTELGVPSLG